MTRYVSILTMTDERESEDKKERSGALTVAVILSLGLPAVYLFATGPITWLDHHGYINERTRDVVHWVYTPLVYLIHNSELVDKLFKQWFALWQQ
jgi:hypothetical protein